MSTILDSQKMAELHRTAIRESENDPSAVFHIGMRVVDAFGRQGVVTDERMVHIDRLCREHGPDISVWCVWCAGKYQRISVCRDDDGTSSEQAADRCDFPPLSAAEAAVEERRDAEEQAMRDAENRQRCGH